MERKFGVGSIGTSLLALYMFHSTPATYLLDWNSVLHWGGLSYFSLVTILSFNYMRTSQTLVNRIFLLTGG